MRKIETNAHNLKVWLNALRSGNFKQGRRVLARRTSEGDMEFCCLGVGCVKAGIEPVEKPKEAGNVAIYQGDNDTLTQMPPAEFYRWLGVEPGMDGQSLYIQMGDGGMRDVAALNDNGRSFEQIANLIERGGIWVIQ